MIEMSARINQLMCIHDHPKFAQVFDDRSDPLK